MHSSYEKAEFSATITPVFGVTWSLRNHFNMLIWSSKIIYHNVINIMCIYYVYLFKKTIYLYEIGIV